MIILYIFAPQKGTTTAFVGIVSLFVTKIQSNNPTNNRIDSKNAGQPQRKMYTTDK